MVQCRQAAPRSYRRPAVRPRPPAACKPCGLLPGPAGPADGNSGLTCLISPERPVADPCRLPVTAAIAGRHSEDSRRHRARCPCRYCDRMTSRPGPARSAGGPRVNAAFSRFGDVARVFDYRAGRLDGTADGPSQGKAGLDRDPLTCWAIAADPKLHHFGATLADKPADGQQDGPGRQALAPPGRRHTEDKPDRARTPADEPDHADRPWALGDRQQERGPVIAVFASPPGKPVGDRPQAALPRRAGIKRRQPCLAQTAVLPGGVADKGICIPGRRTRSDTTPSVRTPSGGRKGCMQSSCAQQRFLAG